MITAKRGRGRPRKSPQAKPEPPPARRGRGRPRKHSGTMNASSKMLLSAAQSEGPLGDFAKLPLELRNAIWSYLLDLNCETCDRCPRNAVERGKDGHFKDRTAILRASHAIYDESFRIMVSINQFRFIVPDNHLLFTKAVQLRSTNLNSNCRYQQDHFQKKYIADWQSWNGMQFVRSIQIYCSNLELVDSSVPNSVLSRKEEIQGIVESLLTMDNLKSVEFSFTLTGGLQLGNDKEQLKIAQDIEETARLTIMPFLCLRLSKLVLDIHLEAWTTNGIWRVCSEYAERVQKILTSPRGSEVPSTEGVKMMEFHEETESEEDFDGESSSDDLGEILGLDDGYPFSDSDASFDQWGERRIDWGDDRIDWGDLRIDW